MEYEWHTRNAQQLTRALTQKEQSSFPGERALAHTSLCPRKNFPCRESAHSVDYTAPTSPATAAHQLHRERSFLPSLPDCAWYLGTSVKLVCTSATGTAGLGKHFCQMPKSISQMGREINGGQQAAERNNSHVRNIVVVRRNKSLHVPIHYWINFSISSYKNVTSYC